MDPAKQLVMRIFGAKSTYLLKEQVTALLPGEHFNVVNSRAFGRAIDSFACSASYQEISIVTF
jgi:hypothetical protein